MAGRKKKQAKKKTRTKRGRRRAARRPDKYDLYQRSVQEPETDVALLTRVFRREFGRPPRRLREDFCGTALLCCEWTRGHRDNEAWGVDLDPEPLKWGLEHNVAPLPAARRERVHLVEGDVRSAETPPADVTVAFNFSYMTFKTRDALRAYFETVRAGLAADGLFALDCYGGADAMRRQREIREHEGFEYVWDQDRFDPITHDCVNHIHFRPARGREIRRAFTYAWRLWTLPELRELLAEAGFRDVGVYWEGTDRRTNEGNGVFTRREHAPDDPAWIAYVMALR